MTEEEITKQIILWQQTADHQPSEVAMTFACEARSHLRAGKVELAERKMKAAFTAANGTP